MADSKLRSLLSGRLSASLAIGIVAILQTVNVQVSESDVVKILEVLLTFWGILAPIISKYREQDTSSC